MKKIKFFIAMFVGISLSALTSCDPVVPETELTKPVVGTDFAISVNAQEVTFSYSGSATSVQWYYGATSEAAMSSAPQSGKEIKVIVNLKGDYVVICSVSNGGDYLFSDPAPFSVETSDLSYMQSGIWKALSGGQGGYNVTFKLDVPATAGDKTLFWHNPLDFWGDKNAGALTNAAWGPWGGTDIYGWGGTPEAGTISFDCENMTYKLVLTDGVKPGSITVKDGEAEALTGEFTGTFVLTVHTRDLTDQITGGDGVSVAKWSTIFNGNYADMVDLDANTEWATITFDEQGGRFPMDKVRVAEGQFTNTDLHNVDIFYADENGLVMNVKRTYEGFAEDNTTKVSNPCWLLYNYIIDGKEYQKEDPYEGAVAPVKTTLTQNDIVGTWKIAVNSAPLGWVDWSNKNYNNLLDIFESADAAFNTLHGWWAFGNPEDAASITKRDVTKSAFANARVQFYANGSCTIVDALNSYDDVSTTYTSATYNTTYTLTNGVVTFANDVVLTCASITLSGTTMYFVLPANANGAATDLWIGQDSPDGDKTYTKAIHLVPVVN